MGSDAEIYIFDYYAFQEEVVPALHNLLEQGIRTVWLDSLLHRAIDDGWSFDFSLIQNLGFKFADICDYLNRDFAYSSSEADQWSFSWQNRACKSSSCSVRQKCPFHILRHQTVAEDFNEIFKLCVVDRCLGESQFIGRTISPMWYHENLLSKQGFADKDPLISLLKKLEYRGFVAGYTFSNSDGIHGWLSADETKELYNYLNALRLPEIETSFSFMKTYAENNEYKAPLGFSFVELSLAFVKTVTSLAIAESKGVLWGNDLSSKDMLA